MTPHPLDRPVWGALTGRQADLAIATGDALRLDPGFGPFAAARDRGAPAQAALAALLDHGEAWLVETEEWPAPPGARVARVAALVQMVADDPAPMQPGDEEAVLLGDADAASMTALALATEPGPWGDKTRHYGQFYGLFDQGRLMAMAGERMRPAPGFDEVSGVCTWPEFQGQGLAARLIRRVMAGMTERGATPFLHSYAGNAHAIRLYEKLGFRVRREMVATVLVRA
ncbi:FR47-like protein [Novosphingobium kunmingense]|uniref:FR47-like protein n=1 Tax=Novosphingobium kunmingense TaxID=1211806 RepID=A0A2N0I3H1_9SPHN|nr:GNAT family N-acetyltransferase [Novosphingobium kunmingense]PKB25758.1 FR47-like protein [Novosphingobium kunmingense]